MDEFGKVTLNLEKLIQEKGISKTQGVSQKMGW